MSSNGAPSSRAPARATSSDAAQTAVSPKPAEPQWPRWNPDATVRFYEVPRSAPPSRRPSFVSRPAPPPDPGALLLDSLALDFETPGRYVEARLADAEGCEIGRGGIGRVCLLVDQHLGREVALKELLCEKDEQPPVEGTLRLLTEARITGQLEHPNIVPVYDMGRRLDGKLYYTMRVIRGQTLADALHRASSLAQRLELLPHVSRACNAIAYAHSRGIIHRDIKPDNIMIGEFGETVVLDWGIAKIRDSTNIDRHVTPRGVAELSATGAGDLVGTPLYMSPEQVSGAADLDETTDVWSLGVLLYLVLSGRLPFHGETLGIVRERILRGSPPSLRKLEPSLSPELVAIVERALAREREHRYPSAKHLASDLDAHMSGARVLAFDYGVFDLARRFARRHRAASWVAVFALFLVIGVAAVFQRRILAERDRAVAAERVALEKEHLARSSLAEHYADRASTSLRRGDLAGALDYAARSLVEKETPRARGLVVALTGQPMWVPSEDVPPPAPLRAPSSARTLDWQRGKGASLSGSDLLAAPLELPTVEPLSSGVLSRDGRFVALGGHRGTLTLWRPDSNKSLDVKGHRGSVVALALTDDGVTLASSGLDRAVHLWETSTGSAIASAPDDLGQVQELAFSPDAKRLFLATEEHELIEVDTADWSSVERISLGEGTVERITVANERELAVLTDVGARAWKKQAPEVFPLFTHPSNVLALEYLSSTRLAAGGLSKDGICILDATSNLCATRLPLRSEQMRAMAFAPASDRLVVGMSNGDIMIWGASSLLPVRFLAGHESAIRGLDFETGGRFLLSASIDGGVIRWDTETGKPVWKSAAASGAQDVTFGAADGHAWVATRAGTVERRDGSGRLLSTTKVSDEWAMAVAVTRDGLSLFVGAGDGSVQQLETRALQVLRKQQPHDGRVLCLELSPDERVLATAGEDRDVLLWDARSLQIVARLQHHKGAVRALRFSPDGRYLTSAGDDRSVRTWDLRRLTVSVTALAQQLQSR